MANNRVDADVIQAAGGLVWRDTPSGKEIAIIHRSRYGDWTLPKGKLAPGERWQDAALREVKEETGCEASLADFAGSFSYLVDGAPKIVLFWHMVQAGDCEFQPSEEVDQLIWLSAKEACEILSHTAERDLLRKSL